MKAGRAARAVAMLAAAPLVLAHVAISLIILSPHEGETVPPDSELVILAQRTLGGVDATSFTVQLDGRHLDPRTGRPAVDGGTPVTIRVGERVAIPVRDLAPGRHQIELDYRPDLDEPARSATVDFFVDEGERDAKGPSPVIRSTALIAGAGLLVLLGAGLLVRRGKARTG